MIEAYCHKSTDDYQHGAYSRDRYQTCPYCTMHRQQVSRTIVTYAVVVVIVASAVIGLIRAFS
jgi:hypothetical protein